ncbi:MAG: acyl-CoA dehydrogenase [Betaproteobacteria bacterium]|nr:acyl-CoA dehydrogenase [Betaproteobacteria bacterium]
MNDAHKTGEIKREPPSELAGLRDSVANFVSRASSLARVRGLRGQLPGYDRAVWAKMAELGWLGIQVPETYGGLGLGLTESGVVAETLARGLLPEPYTSACVLAASAVADGDNPPLKERLLRAIVAGKLVPALAWQEQADCFDPRHSKTSVTREKETAVISGKKQFIAGAGGADGFVVSAQAQDGPELYWLERDTAGVELSFDPWADGTFGATLTLKEARIPASNRIASSAIAAPALARALDNATVVVGAELLGIARRAFELTLDYLRTRQQFGKLIGSFQALQHRAVDCYIQIELASAVLREALAAPSEARAAAASRVKARCATAASLATREAIQMHGAMGFTDECDVGLYVKRTLVLNAWLGGIHHHQRRFAILAPVNESESPAAETGVLPDRLRQLPRDSDWNKLSDEEFRLLLRDFVEIHYPKELRHLPRRVRWHEVQDWNLKLAERGWIAPGWPRIWGGMELSPAKQLIYLDELERGGVGRAPDQGVRQLGPALMKYGTDDQKQTYLPKIISCEHIWCQGYSEPNAGSDLASLTTSAVEDGDEFVINGQKIWTSMAMDSTHIYVLCRTDKTVKKQAGISFIIVDLKTPGITVKPILDIAGHEEFCQIFLDNVRVPKQNLVGGLNNGWKVAKAVLEFERLGIGSPRRPMIALNRLISIGRKLNLFSDLGFLDGFTVLRLNLLDNATLFARFTDAATNGTLGPEVSILKIWGMETFQRITEFCLDWAGTYGAAGSIESDGECTDLLTPYYMSRLITIGGGSSEILRNSIAKHVLRLPS